MLGILQKLEERLVRLEGMILVVLVLLMLGLAVYNVSYRNVLVPLQVEMTTEVVPVTDEPADDADDADAPATEDDDSDGDGAVEDDGAGGFGGGFGEAEADSEDDSAGGFAGGFGDDAEETAEETPDDTDDGAGGFGGGFDDEDEADTDDGAGGFGGGFGDDSSSDGVAVEEAGKSEEAANVDSAGEDVETEEPQFETTSVEPEPGSITAFVVDTIDSMKLEWIDTLLRQLVLIVGFLGAMLATRRRKHITIDALSKVLSPTQRSYVHLLTNGLSITVCVLLAIAGADLVAIGLKYPGELMPWAEEWTFQLAFPIGFGLLALHFTVRLLEAVAAALTGEGIEDEEAVEITAGGDA